MKRLTHSLMLALWVSATATSCATSRTEQGGTNTNWLSCRVDADCAALPGSHCEEERCVPAPGADGGASGSSSFAPEKGPAHTLALPVPGERDWRYVDGDESWRYVAPENPGTIYDVAFWDGRYYMLHGLIENDQKVILSEVNWLSSTADGLNWTTKTLTTLQRESYTRLASDGRSLLLAGLRHVARLVGDDELEPYAALEQDTAPPVLVGFPGGYAVGRFEDVQLIDRQNAVERVLELELAQFRSGVFADGRLLLVGPFTAATSTDGRNFRTLASPCNGCGMFGLTHGNGIYLAADPETLFTSNDGEHWQAHAWERATPQPGTPDDEIGEDRIARIDFTGGHFTLHTAAGNTSLSADGVTWTNQLLIPLGQIGPAACNGRCIVAGGRLLLPPRVLRAAEPPEGADERSPYYCAYGEPEREPCFSCSGATVAECREGAICRQRCETASDCPEPGSGRVKAECSQTQIGGECVLYCDASADCPSGMTCSGGTCLYVFDDPRCGSGSP